MSAGAFSLEKYELDNGQISPIRVQPETVAFTDGTDANDSPTGAITLNLFARARKGNREYGIGARFVTIQWDAAPPAGYQDDALQIPILDKSVFDGYALGGGYTYLGSACSIISKTGERLR